MENSMKNVERFKPFFPNPLHKSITIISRWNNERIKNSKKREIQRTKTRKKKTKKNKKQTNQLLRAALVVRFKQLQCIFEVPMYTQ